MSRSFGSLAQLAGYIAGAVVAVESGKRRGLEKAAQIVETEAKRVLGTYDYGWPPLKPETVARKGADTPLLETGEMRDSIGHDVDADSATVGSNEEKALFHELGTSKTPPRPFLSGAAMQMEEEIKEAIGGAVIRRLS